MLYFIINPKTSGGLGEKYWYKLKNILDEKRVVYNYSMTTVDRNAEMISKDLASNLNIPLTIVVLGGDGSINEIINGVKDYSNITLGILPLGSGNDFVRSFGKKVSIEEHLEKVIRPKRTVSYNIGVIRKESGERKFLVSSGLGFDAHITHNVNNSNFRKIFKNTPIVKLVYIFSTIQSLFQYKPLKYTVWDGSKKFVFHNGYYCIVMNTPYEGKGVKFCPDAIGDDNILDFCFINIKSKFKIIILTLLAFLGKHVHLKSTYMSKGKSFRVEVEKPTYYHTDGESSEMIDWAEFYILDEKVKVIVE